MEQNCRISAIILTRPNVVSGTSIKFLNDNPRLDRIYRLKGISPDGMKFRYVLDKD